jgi:SAM-dependent methyltransferase
MCEACGLIIPECVLVILLLSYFVFKFIIWLAKNRRLRRERLKKKNDDNSIIKIGIMEKIATIFAYIIGFMIFISAIGITILANNSEIRAKFFSKLMTNMSKDSSLDEIRCDLFKNIKGKVLELGPGPGTNYKCWKDNKDITEWVGVEPNNYFSDSLIEEKELQKLSFPTKVVWMNGESNLDIDVGSFDYVIGTHVLCSVSNVNEVLIQVKRALKPGGIYYFIEHVIDETEGSILYYIQNFIQPIFKIIANGCTFRDTWNDINTLKDEGFQVVMNHFKAPVPIFLIKNHIKGYAVLNEVIEPTIVEN